ELVRSFLTEGSVAILYDDTFDGVTDKGDALLAVADLIDAVGGTSRVGAIPMLDHANSMGARDLDILPEGTAGGSWGTPFTAQLQFPDSPVRAAFLLGANPMGREASPELETALRKLDLLVVHELFLTDTAKLADVILPAASFAEKAGTFTNTERRVQALKNAVPAPGIARPDWETLVDLSQYFESPLNYSLPREIWDEIAERVPAYQGVRYQDIGATGVRPQSLQPA
ncbi:MAG TPA: molybdopterin-dependent oxidoreductase, partial [Chloroflexota bacterium]